MHLFGEFESVIFPLNTPMVTVTMKDETIKLLTIDLGIVGYDIWGKSRHFHFSNIVVTSDISNFRIVSASTISQAAQVGSISFPFAHRTETAATGIDVVNNDTPIEANSKRRGDF